MKVQPARWALRLKAKHMSSRHYLSVKAKAPVTSLDLPTAIAFLKENASKNFDETVEVHIRLGIDSSRSDHMVRGSVVLPHGTPKQKKIAVFTNDPVKQDKARAAGAAIVGGEEIIVRIEKEGGLAADIAIATPDMMPKIAKVAKILGPKGLMPNPKTGTVTPDPVKIMEELNQGKVSFKMDQLGNIHEPVAKVRWDTDKIAQNVQAVVEAVKAAKPATFKGNLMRTVTVKSTMSIGLRLTLG